MRVFVFCAALLTASAAIAQDTPRDAPLTWLEQPDGRNFVEHYPVAALRQRVVGFGTVECQVDTESRKHCFVVNEGPQGWGFGAAALRIAQDFRLRAGYANGVPQAGRIRRTIRFNSPNHATWPPPSWTPAQVAFHETINPPDLPIWDSAPNADAMLALYPAQALQDQQRGRGLLSCLVQEDRSLKCERVSETPAGMGFGDAALAASEQLRVSEFSAEFIATHRTMPFLLPIIFSDRREDMPVSRTYTGIGPMHLPSVQLRHERDYPPAALALRIEATVTLLCTIRATPPADCIPEAVSEPGWGFGEAAVVAARRSGLVSEDNGHVPGDQFRFDYVFVPPSPT